MILGTIVLVYSVEKPDLVPFEMPARFKTDVAYFMTPAGDQGVPQLATTEYWIRRTDAQIWLEDGVILVVSPLDASAKAELELTDEQEAWLQWMVDNDIQHIRLAAP